VLCCKLLRQRLIGGGLPPRQQPTRRPGRLMPQRLGRDPPPTRGKSGPQGGVGEIPRGGRHGTRVFRSSTLPAGTRLSFCKVAGVSSAPSVSANSASLRPARTGAPHVDQGGRPNLPFGGSRSGQVSGRHVVCVVAAIAVQHEVASSIIYGRVVGHVRGTRHHYAP
jgi:hypothetical protein